MQCAACTIDLTTAGKGYAATGRQTPAQAPAPAASPPTRPAGAGGRYRGRKNWRRYALITDARTARHQAVAACAACPDAGGRSGGVTWPDAGGSVSAAMHAVSRRRI